MKRLIALALLTTGVKLAGSSLTTGNTPREGAFNVNGNRTFNNVFLLDGVDNNDKSVTGPSVYVSPEVVPR